VVFAAAILAKGTLASRQAFFRYIFCHVDHPIRTRYTPHYLREASFTQVPEKIVTRASLQQKNAQTESANFPERQQERGGWVLSLYSA
jgi:hypothetical protein